MIYHIHKKSQKRVVINGELTGLLYRYIGSLNAEHLKLYTDSFIRELHPLESMRMKEIDKELKNTEKMISVIEKKKLYSTFVE